MGAEPGRRLRLGTGRCVTAVTAAPVETAETIDLAVTPLRELNQRLHDVARTGTGPRRWRVLHPNGAHALACGLDADLEVEIDGHAGYYCAGMNQQASVRVRGSARRLARVAVHHDTARHHVLRDAGSGTSAHANARPLVHAGAVVAGVPLDLDLEVGVEAGRKRMGAVRMEDAPATRPCPCVGDVMEALIELAERRHREVDRLGRLGGRGGHAATRSQA